jgi:SAM-dependent methyltransferase
MIDMVKLSESLTALSIKHGFIRSARYDQGWMFDNSMGPNPLWLIEWLTRDMTINKEMLVLDMGCGKALTSIFLAKEYECAVFANDLWISPEENLKRVTEAGLEKKVFPIHAEAHALPYAKDQFDSITSIDAYHYFGTDDTYLPYFVEFLKPGGQIGIVIPGWSKALSSNKTEWPKNLNVKEYVGFHTKEWWESQLNFSDLLEIEISEYLPNAKLIWLDAAKAMYETKNIMRDADGTTPQEKQKELDFWKEDIDFLEADEENYITIIRVIARKKTVALGSHGRLSQVSHGALGKINKK